ncbi:hypothetical protein GCM10018783_39760 [Streptomyces griseosporeus]|nr:hypothetical protein GCM10018783_39760 [Streptomyces griseosporeus]
MGGELAQVVAGRAAGLAQAFGQPGGGGRAAAAQGVQQLHPQRVGEAAQGAGVEVAQFPGCGCGLCHAYKGIYAKLPLQALLCKGGRAVAPDNSP